MKRTLIATALAATAASLTAAAQTQQVTLQGCVMPGVEKDTYFISHLTEVAEPGGATLPDVADGRRVLFWLDDDGDVRKHMNRKVEIQGQISGFEKSEAELKAGRHKDGGMLIEFEGPGKDVLLPAAVVGTAGRTEPEKNDIPTYLARTKVRKVTVISGECK